MTFVRLLVCTFHKEIQKLRGRQLVSLQLRSPEKPRTQKAERCLLSTLSAAKDLGGGFLVASFDLGLTLLAVPLQGFADALRIDRYFHSGAFLL